MSSLSVMIHDPGPCYMQELTNQSGGVGIDDLDHNTVGCSDAEEQPEKHKTDVQEVRDLLRQGPLLVVAVVIQP